MVTTLHDKLTDRLGAIRNQYDDTSILARELVDVVTEWLNSDQLAAVLVASGSYSPDDILMTLVEEARR